VCPPQPSRTRSKHDAVEIAAALQAGRFRIVQAYRDNPAKTSLSASCQRMRLLDLARKPHQGHQKPAFSLRTMQFLSQLADLF
jgi:hypothetical protein